MLAGALERLPHPPIPIRLVVALVRHCGSRPAAARPPPCAPSARRSRAGSRRTPTRPRSGRSARPRNELAVLIDERAHFGRSVSSSRAKNRLAELQDLVRAAQLLDLLAQLLDLLALLAASAALTATLIDLGLAHALAQRLGRKPEISSDMSDRTARTRTPAESRDQSIPGGTSSVVTSAEVLLTQGQIVLEIEPPSNPAWLTPLR